MSDIPEFNGFSKKTVTFLDNLAQNNNREWFEAHRADYEAHLMEPAKAFVVAFGKRLRSILPGIIAAPKVNKSIFRLNRDTRFSLDKSPYKTNLGIYFWEGTRNRLECSGCYFHIEPSQFMLGVGIYIFPPLLLGRFRQWVVHPRHGKQLSAILKKLAGVEGLELGGMHYKKVPAGYDSSHPNASLLQHNGLYVGYYSAIPKDLYSRELIDYCFERFKPAVPLHKWLVGLTAKP